MANKMLIDAAHPEETRVVVLRGSRVEEFDFESASKKPLRGNIYLAKVTRVEPSLQAAFIEYGGNRHGFLAFSEIHPDYYQIPVADRQALLEEEARAHREEDDEQKQSNGRRSRRRRGSPQNSGKRAETGDESLSSDVVEVEGSRSDDLHSDANELHTENDDNIPGLGSQPDFVDEAGPSTQDEPSLFADEEAGATLTTPDTFETGAPIDAADAPTAPSDDVTESSDSDEAPDAFGTDLEDRAVESLDAEAGEPMDDNGEGDDHEGEEEVVEQIGGDASEDVPYRAPRLRRHYKIQEVIKRRQILLVQVVKEERGNKGAALTTYLSLAGRYSVLMPNTARGGGISRKITDSDDRKRLKAIAQQLDVPEGMGVILRTAGAARSDQEVRRDFEYLLRMWETVRELTLRSSAPMLVYEEGSLIKRAIRDLYSKEIDEICVAGDTGYREAKDYMRLLMPTHVKNVQLYRDTQPIFAKSGVEAQLDAMFSNHVTLRSGGYIVINQTEALVAIDVNSGRSTREHNIEDTAVRTNLEAADEVARQLRLRDLAGLIVVDFIDMEEGRNNRAVERRIKDALKNDRARIQIGRISHFGLLEMSRQRIRTGVLEGSTVLCPHCAGAGTVRSTSSIALHVLRVLEDTLIRSAAYNLAARTRTEVALYILNQKRPHLMDLEQRFGVSISVLADATLTGAVYHAIERGEPATPVAMISSRHGAPAEMEAFEEDQELEGALEEEIAEDGLEERQAEVSTDLENAESGERKRKRRRRRRGRDRDARGPDQNGDAEEAAAAGEDSVSDEDGADEELDAAEPTEVETASFEADVSQVAEISDVPEADADEDQPAEALADDVDEVKPEVAPRRRRSRRSAAKPAVAAEEEGVASVDAAVEEAPPRRSRRTKAKPVEEAMPTLAFEGPSADRDVGADTAKNHPADDTDAPDEASSELSTASDEQKVVADTVEAQPEPTSSPAESEPQRPKRSGWWQRAKATITG